MGSMSYLRQRMHLLEGDLKLSMKRPTRDYFKHLVVIGASSWLWELVLKPKIKRSDAVR
jgi:hypothetical protein